MFIKKNIFKTVLGTLLAGLALYLGRVFWIYFLFSFGTIASILIIPVMLGYMYIVISLARFKSWAWGMFFTIVTLAVLIEILLVLVEGPTGNPIEGLSHCIFWVSLVAIPVFGISALIRKILNKPR